MTTLIQVLTLPNLTVYLIHWGQVVAAHTLRRQKQANLCFEASLVYKIASATQRHPVLKEKKITLGIVKDHFTFWDLYPNFNKKEFCKGSTNKTVCLKINSMC